MKVLRKIQRWRTQTKKNLRRLWPLKRTIDLPTWRTVDLPYGPGLALPVDGEDLWFASPDVTLEPTQEAAICALAQWCAQESVALRLPAERPSPLFLANVHSATALMGEWWNHPPVRFLTSEPLVLPAPTQSVVAGRRALFFSSGVDAFYSLVCNPDTQVLVYLVGYDIPLTHREAWELKIASLREIARARGLPLFTIFTNLRKHHTVGSLEWGNQFGVVLTIVAHLLRSQATNWIISASWWPGYIKPSGSRPDLDWRWGSESLVFHHFGDDKWRGEKLAVLAGDPLARTRVMVCFKTSATGNCGRCEKCVRTRLAHHCEVPGRRCESIPDHPPLAEALDGIEALRFRHLTMLYERSRSFLSDGDPIASAIDRLLERSRPKPRWSRVKHYLLRHLPGGRTKPHRDTPA